MAAADPKAGEEDHGEGQQDASLDDRVGSLEAGQQSLSGKIDQILGILSKDGGGGHGDEPTDPPQRGGTPGSIAHQIREQLDKRDREDAARKKEDERDGTITALREQVAALTEQEPTPPPRRVERLMGWT